MQPKISIIVPVYKAEKYLHRCIDSILAQSFADFELLLIDDGSPDASGAICDEYAKNDYRIRVIHKENGGVASARQCGIDNATGEYTIHADPDDWVEPDMFEQLYNKAVEKNADMVISDFIIEGKGQRMYIKQEVPYSTFDTLQLLLSHKLHGSLCNKLIKLSCYKKYGISFSKGLNYSEDYLVCVKILMQKVIVAYIDKAFYHYDTVINTESITRKSSGNSIIAQYTMFMHYLEETLSDMPDIILMNKIRLKALLFKSNRKSEFNAFYPEVNRFIWKADMSLSERMILRIATLGWFRIAFNLNRVRNKIITFIKHK